VAVDAKLEKVNRVNEIVKRRAQSLAQMALSWLLNNKRITTVLIGVAQQSSWITTWPALPTGSSQVIS